MTAQTITPEVGDYVYVTGQCPDTGAVLQISVKRESEGFIIDAWNHTDGFADDPIDTMGVAFSDMADGGIQGHGTG